MRRKRQKPLLLRYSGSRSISFWDRINSLEGVEKDAAYSMACTLQGAEWRVLRYIREAEKINVLNKRKED